MPNLSSDLSDPQPPVPGERERALVAARAHALGRRRHLVQGGGALALVAAVAVSVAALTAGGSSGAGGTNRVEAASSASDTTVSTPTTQATTPTTVATVPAPAPTEDTTPAATQEAPAATSAETAPVVPVAPSTFTLSGTVTGNPANTTVTLTLTGPGGSVEVVADAAGSFSASNLAPGDYSIIGMWVDNATGTAAQASRLGSVPLFDNGSVSLVFHT